jgi:hypothetical protein
MTKAIPMWIDPRNGAMVAKKAGPRTRTVSEMITLGYLCAGNYRKHKFRMVLA